MIRSESFTQSTESFAAERKAFLSDTEDTLRPHVAEALRRVGLSQWGRPIVAQALDVFERTARAEVDAWNPILDDMRDAFAEELAESLQKTKVAPAEQFDAQIERITRWVSTMAINAGTEAATTSDPSDGVGLEWITMGDADVRHTHEETNGQVVPTGQHFTVGEVEMLYPGQPVGDPENWINCRCTVRPTMLDGFTSGVITASATSPDAGDQVAEEPFTSTVIVALPAADDPISAASSESSGAHATLLFLGDSSTLDEEALKSAVEQFVTDGKVGVITEQVNGRATLGKDAADVVLFDAANLVFIREGLLGMDALSTAFNSVEQFPTWLPHVTLGYPEAPAPREYRGEVITFDRLAVWHGESRTEYPLGEKMSDDHKEPTSEVSLTAAADPLPVEPEPTEDEAIKDEEEAWQAAQDEEMNPTIPWHGILAPEGTPSGDGRQFGLGALTNRDLPLPLKAMTIDDEGHKGSFIVGRIDRIFREDNMVKGEGVFDSTPEAYEAVRKLAEKMWRGVSVDVDAVEAAMFSDEDVEDAPEQVVFSKARIASATLCAIPAFAEAYVALGTWADAAADAEVSDVRHPAEEVKPENAEELANFTCASECAASHPGEEHTFEVSVPTKTKDGPGWITEPAPTKRITGYWVDGRGAAKIGWGAPGDFNRCRTQLAKYVANPDWLAGLCANLHYRALGAWPGQAAAQVTEMSESTDAQSMSLVASAAPSISADYFRNPMLTEATPVTRGEDGHIFGHLATWDTCHLGFEVCTTAPQSQMEYGYFLTGQVFTDAGPVAVGQLTVGGGHAPDGITMRAAVAHYDNVGTAVADVNVGEDEFGIWFSGKIRDWATEQQIHELFAAGPSGDWRGIRVGGRESLEMVAAHAVNVPGFPVPRTRFAMDGDRQVSLVAAGYVAPKTAITPEFRAAMNEYVAESQRKARAERLRANVRAFKAESIKSKINEKKVS